MNSYSYAIHDLIPRLQRTLRQHSIVILTAQPGAGKTTHVPLALLHETWLTPQKY